MGLGKPKNILFLAGGVAVGVAAMYLLDSEAGRRRREALADAANSAAHHAGDALHSAGEALGEHAAQAASAVAAAAPAGLAAATGLRRLIGSYHDHAHHLAERWDHLRHAAQPQAARAVRAVQAGGEMLAPVVTHARSALGRIGGGGRKVAKVSLLIVPVTIGGVVCVGAGAGAMYLLDPDSGRRRRKSIRDGVAGAVSKVGRFARAGGQSVRSQVEGIARNGGLIYKRGISSDAT